jgi:hypothetical protein
MGMGTPNNHSNPPRAISASYVCFGCVVTGEPPVAAEKLIQTVNSLPVGYAFG